MVDRTLWDIPAPLKEYHNIEFDHETNQYFIHGHVSGDGIRSPFINIPAYARMHSSLGELVIDIDFKFVSVTLFPLSVMVYISSVV